MRFRNTISPSPSPAKIFDFNKLSVKSKIHYHVSLHNSSCILIFPLVYNYISILLIV